MSFNVCVQRDGHPVRDGGGQSTLNANEDGGSMESARQKSILCVALVAVMAGVAGCDRTARPDIATAIARPAPVTGVEAVNLPFGRESIYSLVNAGNMADADALLRDVWRIPRFADVTLRGGPTWREDPYHQKYWRFYFFSLRPTTNLLWAYYRTGRTVYRDKLIAILRSYIAHDAAHPREDKLGMDDPHALAFRAMVLLNFYVKLKRSGDLPANLDAPMVAAIGRIANKLQLPINYQGTNNHGFTQAIALLLVSVNLPQLATSKTWGAMARIRLHTLLSYTIDVDGVENEKSPFYHFYVLDFMLQTEDWAKANDVPLPPNFHERITSMARYATEIIWPNGEIPLLGSSVQLRPIRSITLYRDLIARMPDFEFALTAGAQGTPPTERAILFPNSGQAILRSPIDPAAKYADNTQLLMDVGPPISEHSHHEALGVDYYSHGRDLLVDSGLNTYSHGTAYDFFHGTTAHNTISVDGRDQDGGPVRAGRTMTGDGWSYQSGMSQVYRGVTHRRSVVLLGRDLLLVVDDIAAATPHVYRQLWHLFPNARPLVTGTHAEIYDEYDNSALSITQASEPTGLAVEQYFGTTAPMQGWYSDEYGLVEPNHVIGYTATGTSTRYYTLITSGKYAGRRATVTGSGRQGDFRVDVCVGDYAGHVTIHHQAAPGELVTVAPAKGCGNA
jgi:Heparinase II/III-like protein/Heparinase II/III N-terminus